MNDEADIGILASVRPVGRFGRLIVAAALLSPSGACGPAGSSTCGNGTPESGEECDEGSANSDLADASCREDCTAQRCGDGITDTGEECDDGNNNNSDACPDGPGGTCQAAVCGDGHRWDSEGGSEACDDANARSLDGCSSGCTAEVHTWTEVTPSTTPGARFGHGMAYDSARGKLVLFGGYNIQFGGFLQDTWEWDGAAATWTEVTPATSPTTRRATGAMAYDSARGTVVLFGGSNSDGPLLQDTWEWDGAAATWTEVTPATSPAPREGHGIAYDSARGKVVLVGGYDPYSWVPDTWEWDGAAATWTEVTPATSPTPDAGFALAYDSARGKVLLFENDDFGGGVPETWEWDGATATWTEVTPATSPTGSTSHPMAYDSARRKVVLFGGDTGNGQLQDTWEWDGAAATWTEVTLGTSPAPRRDHGMAYDSARGKVVLFGGIAGSVLHEDTWEFDLFTSWPDEICNNTTDDDSDTLVDCEDPDCTDEPCDGGVCVGGVCQ